MMTISYYTTFSKLIKIKYVKNTTTTSIIKTTTTTIIDFYHLQCLVCALRGLMLCCLLLPLEGVCGVSKRKKEPISKEENVTFVAGELTCHGAVSSINPPGPVTLHGTTLYLQTF